MNFMQRFFYSIPYLILPIICFTYGSVAFLSRTMRTGILNELQQDYIRTARAKGLTEKKIIWHHAFRNSLLPIITVFASVFPAVIGGSVILETIFTLPGMGRAIYQAIGNHDYNLIVAVFTLTGFLTMVGFLISDILYTIADPRIRFEK
jgi:peptide/nickel transport system permease protein